MMEPVAPMLVLAAEVLELTPALAAVVVESVAAEEVTVGLTAVVDDIVVDVSAVAVSDLVEELQPLRAKPARRSVNKIEFFIGGLSCAPTDRPVSARFRPGMEWLPGARNGVFAHSHDLRQANDFAPAQRLENYSRSHARIPALQWGNLA